ncbi:MAG: RNA-guided endonuclease TnpB family protein [Bacilli bacterium]
MMRAYQFRIYPTADQRQCLSQCFGASRYVWNWALQLIKDNFNHTEMIRYSWGGDPATSNEEDALTMKFHGCKDTSLELFNIDATKCSLLLTPAARRKAGRLPCGLQHEPGLKDVQPWLHDVPDKILRYSLRNLGTAFKNFFKADKNGARRGYPKHKTRRDHQSIQFQGENVRLDTRTGLMSVPGLKNVEVRLHRSMDGKIGTTTISKTKSGKYYVSFQVDDGRDLPLTKPVSRDRVIGIDVGLASYISTSEGDKIDGLQPLREAEQRLAVLQRRLSRKQKGSKNQDKARLKVSRMHEKIANQRSDFQHKLSRELVDNHDAIVLESLNIKGMVRNHHLAKSISDAGWSEFMRQIKYKADWAGKTVIEIGQWEPSSKTCHSCGHKLDKLTLDVREWTCPRCGSVLDRDINAAINIRAIGIDQLYTTAI